MKLAFALWISTLSLFAAGTLDFYVVDVGQGNATIVVAPSGQTILSDAGPPVKDASHRIRRTCEI